MTPLFTFDEGQARAFVPNPAFAKRAILVWEGADYHLECGDQHFDGPHMRILGEEPYGTALQEFFSTHLPVPERVDHYVKNVVIQAVQVTEEVLLETVVGGRLEGTSKVPPGAYILRNPGGELYYNSREEFERRYVPVDSR